MGGAWQATQPFSISIPEGVATLAEVNTDGTVATAFCSVWNENPEVVESSVVIVVENVLQQDFSFKELLVDSQEEFPHAVLLPKKSIDAISPPQKCIFTARLLVATNRIKIQIMETIFFIPQRNRIFKTYVL